MDWVFLFIESFFKRRDASYASEAIQSGLIRSLQMGDTCNVPLH
jgi:hypothetical protein